MVLSAIVLLRGCFTREIAASLEDSLLAMTVMVTGKRVDRVDEVDKGSTDSFHFVHSVHYVHSLPRYFRKFLTRIRGLVAYLRRGRVICCACGGAVRGSFLWCGAITVVVAVSGPFMVLRLGD